MSISIFNLLISVWYSPVIFLNFELSIPNKSIKKQVKIALGYPAFSIREKYWKVWNEGAKTVTEDEDIPF